MTSIQNDAILINGYTLQYNIDSSEADDYLVRISGWSLLLGVPSYSLDCNIDFKGQEYNFSIKPQKMQRSDVTKDRSNSVNYDESGFLIEIPLQNVGPDRYDVYLTFRKREAKEILASFPCLGIKIN